MVKQELIEIITQKFKQVQNIQTVRQSLIADGWEEIDIDDTILHMQSTGSLTNLQDQISDNINKYLLALSPRKTLTVLIGLIVFAMVFLGISYLRLHPYGLDAENRDADRAKASSVFSNALNNYYNANHVYPSSLDQLVPKYIDILPLEPKTQKQYEYSLLKNGDYKFCIYYETRQSECVGSWYFDSSTNPSGLESSAPFDITSFITYDTPTGWRQEVWEMRNTPGNPLLPEVSPQDARKLYSPGHVQLGSSSIPSAQIDIFRLKSKGEMPYSLQQLMDELTNNKTLYPKTPEYIQTTIAGNPAIHFITSLNGKLSGDDYFILQGNSYEYTWHISFTNFSLMNDSTSSAAQTKNDEAQFDQLIQSIHFK